MKYFKKLIGDRIYLSPMNREDLETFTKWMNDFKVTDGTGRSCQVMTIQMEEKWLEEALLTRDTMFSIVKLENNELIGNCSLFDINHIKRSAELGIMIGEETSRNNGYGKEAIGLLLDFGFNYLNLNNIMLKVFAFNDIAISAYTKMGFKEIGRRRQSNFINGKYYDEIYMDILAEEFIEDRIRNKNI